MGLYQWARPYSLLTCTRMPTKLDSRHTYTHTYTYNWQLPAVCTPTPGHASHRRLSRRKCNSAISMLTTPRRLNSASCPFKRPRPSANQRSAPMLNAMHELQPTRLPPPPLHNDVETQTHPHPNYKKRRMHSHLQHRCLLRAWQHQNGRCLFYWLECNNENMDERWVGAGRRCERTLDGR